MNCADMIMCLFLKRRYLPLPLTCMVCSTLLRFMLRLDSVRFRESVRFRVTVTFLVRTVFLYMVLYYERKRTKLYLKY